MIVTVLHKVSTSFDADLVLPFFCLLISLHFLQRRPRLLTISTRHKIFILLSIYCIFKIIPFDRHSLTIKQQ
mgnify:CR=1 FL=1